MPDFFKPSEHAPQTSRVYTFGLARAITCAALLGPAVVSSHRAIHLCLTSRASGIRLLP